MKKLFAILLALAMLTGCAAMGLPRGSRFT